MRRTRLGSALSLLLACGPTVSPDDNGDASGDATGDTSSGSATSPSTTESPTTTTAGDPTSTTATTAEPLACEDDSGVGCSSYCAALVTCDSGQGPFESCVTACLDRLAAATADCQPQLCEAFACYGALDCTALAEGTAECDTLAAKAQEACGTCVAPNPAAAPGSAGGLCLAPDGQCEDGVSCNLTENYCYVPDDPCQGFGCGGPFRGCCSVVDGLPSCTCAEGFESETFALYCCPLDGTDPACL